MILAEPTEWEITHNPIHKLVWGTYGKPANFPLKWVRLIDCSTEHLQAILLTQPQIHPRYESAIKTILTNRRADLPCYLPRRPDWND